MRNCTAEKAVSHIVFRPALTALAKAPLCVYNIVVKAYELRATGIIKEE